MEVRAHLRHLLIAPRKVRLVIDVVRGLSVEQALDQLSVQTKAAARPIKKLIQSAMANARHNHKVDPNTLFIKSIIANEGPRLKRYRARAFGRAAVLQKRMSHVSVVLADRTGRKTAAKFARAGGAEVPNVPRPTLRRRPAQPAVTSTPARVQATGPAPERQRAAQDPTVPRKGEA